MDTLRAAALIFATLTMGLMAGVMFLYSTAIMPGLRKTDDRTFVGAFQQIDTAIINPLFLSIFLGTLVVTGVAGVVHLSDEYRSGLPWIAAAFVLYLAVVIATLAINVPRNNEIKAAGHPDELADVAEVRRRFNEARWLASNHFRTAATTVALGCLAWALVLLGRAA